MTKHRILRPDGWTEFRLLADAVAYRDAHHPGCEIIEVPYEEATE